jgi:hypothetical protein
MSTTRDAKASILREARPSFARLCEVAELVLPAGGAEVCEISEDEDATPAPRPRLLVLEFRGFTLERGPTIRTSTVRHSPRASDREAQNLKRSLEGALCRSN